MRDAFRDVLEFHRKLAPHLIGRFPKMPDGGKNQLCVRLIEEEFNELKEAVDAFRDVLEFHIGRFPKMPDGGKNRLRVRLIEEEFNELKEAVDANDIVKVADALGDLCYVAIGMAVTCGIDLPSVLDEIHASNMAKEGGPTREDGKILKPDGWEPPNIGKMLAYQFPVGLKFPCSEQDAKDVRERVEAYNATGRLPE